MCALPEAVAWGGGSVGLPKRLHGRLVGGVDMGRSRNGRLACLVFRPLTAEARVRGGVGGLGGGGMGTLPSAWAACVCFFRMHPTAACTRGRAGGLGGGGVGGLPSVAWMRIRAGGLGGSGVGGFPFLG